MTVLLALLCALAHAEVVSVHVAGVPVAWMDDPEAGRSRILWSLARGSADSEAPEDLSLLMVAMNQGTLGHPGPRWRWELGQVGASVRIGASAHRLWVWLEAPVGHEAEAVELLVEMLSDPQLHPGQLRASRRELARERSFTSRTEVVHRAREVWLGARGCPVEPPLAWGGSPRIGTRARLRRLHGEILEDGEPSVLIHGPRSPEELEGPLAVLAGWGGESVRLECSLSSQSEHFESQIIAVHREGERAVVHALQPVASDASGTHAMAAWVLMKGFSSRVNRALRTESGWTYGSWTEIRQLSGLRVLEMELETDVGRALDAILLIEEVLASSAPINEEELIAARVQAEQESVRRQMDPSAWMAWASWRQHLGLLEQEQERALENVSLEEVRAAAEEVRSGARRSWLIVGDVEQILLAAEASGVSVDEVWTMEDIGLD